MKAICQVWLSEMKRESITSAAELESKTDGFLQLALTLGP